MTNPIIIGGPWEVEEGSFWKPSVDAMHQDRFRMGTRMGDDMTVVHEGHDYKTMELTHIDLPIGLKIRPIKDFNNEALQEWLSNHYERGAYRETKAHETICIEKCPACDHPGVYYIPFRLKTNESYFETNPPELHYAVCSKCGFFKRLK